MKPAIENVMEPPSDDAVGNDMDTALRDAESMPRNRQVVVVDIDAEKNSEKNRSADVSCTACRRKASGGNPKYAHHDQCEKSIYYGKCQDEKEAMKEEKKRRQKEGLDKRAGMVQAEKALTHLLGNSEKAKELLHRAESEKRKAKRRQEMKPKTLEESVEVLHHDEPRTTIRDFDNMLTSRYLCEYIDQDNTKRVTRAPRAVESIIKCINGLCPTLKRDCNEINRGFDNETKDKWFKEQFPPGTITFKVPRLHGNTEPHLAYCAAEDVKIVIIRWELQSDKKLMCPYCKKCELVHGRFGIKKSCVHPIFDVGGKVMWSVVMHYNCSDCNAQIRGDDQALLDSLPVLMRESYPCHPAWNTKDAPFRLSRELVRIMEHATLSCASKYITKLLEGLYNEDRDRFLNARMYWSNAIENATDKKDSGPMFMSFLAWLGDVEIPTSTQLQLLQDGVVGKISLNIPPSQPEQVSPARPKKGIDNVDNIQGRFPLHNFGLPGRGTRTSGVPQPILVPPYPPPGNSIYLQDGMPPIIRSPYPPQGFVGHPNVPGFVQVDSSPPWLRGPKKVLMQATVDLHRGKDKSKCNDENVDMNGVGDRSESTSRVVSGNNDETKQDTGGDGEEKSRVRPRTRDNESREMKGASDSVAEAISVVPVPGQQSALEAPLDTTYQAPVFNDGKSESPALENGQHDLSHNGTHSLIRESVIGMNEDDPSRTPVHRNADSSSKRPVVEPKWSDGSKKSKVIKPASQFDFRPSMQHHYSYGYPYMYPPPMGLPYHVYPPPRFMPYTDATHSDTRRSKSSNHEKLKKHKEGEV